MRSSEYLLKYTVTFVVKELLRGFYFKILPGNFPVFQKAGFMHMDIVKYEKSKRNSVT